MEKGRLGVDRKGSSVRRELVHTCREKEQEQKSQAKVVALGPHGLTTVRVGKF